MSLDVWIEDLDGEELYSGNITHNLTSMANAASIYYPLWRPDEIDVNLGSELIDYLELGLNHLESDPDTFRQYDSPNGWGVYDDFVRFVREYLDACRKWPDGIINVGR